MRGAEETLGKGGAGASTVVTERVAKATALAQDVSGRYESKFRSWHWLFESTVVQICLHSRTLKLRLARGHQVSRCLGVAESSAFILFAVGVV